MFITLLLLAFLQNVLVQEPNGNGLIEKYEEAMDLYFAANPTSETDSLATSYFKAILKAENRDKLLSKEQLLEVNEKLGNLYLIAEADQQAVASYRSALSMDQFPELEDSLFFSANLFLGEAYYKQSKPDSAVHFLKKAESIFDQKDSKNEGSRLFNSLGVYYYETGNFSQAINYFTKANNLVIGTRDIADLDTYYKYAYYSFTSNIASSLVQLNRLDSAEKVFLDMLELGIDQDKIHLDLVDLYLEMEAPDQALNFLEKINSQSTISSIGYANQLAEIHFQKEEFLEARHVLNDLIGEYQGDEANFLAGNRNFKLGYSHQLLGKVYFEEMQYKKALSHFQYAILHFDPGFSNLDPMANPSDHGMGFAAYALFENFIQKANTMMMLADKDTESAFWEAAINTYNEAFNKVFYLNAFYDNEQARVFLGEFVLPAYQQAIEQVLAINAQKPHYDFLEQAFLWAESSKSISLLAGQNESKLKSEIGIPEPLLEEERQLNFQLTSLIQQINASEDTDLNKELQKELLDIRLALSRLHHQFNEIPEYLFAKTTGRIENLQELKDKFLPQEVLLISIFESNTNRHLFYLDKNTLDIVSHPLDMPLAENVEHFKHSIFNAQLGERFEKQALAKEIYQAFFAGGEKKIGEYDELLIIPHGIWRDFPFDLLVDETGNFLIENFAIGYQFSAHFLNIDELQVPDLENMLSMAPYAPGTESSVFADLPYSLAEIKDLPGRKLIGKEATKASFLASIGVHQILHLATHAEAFLENPYKSFIAFYPDTSDHRLYLEELQYKRFENTALIYLSSCETNYGEISASEGVLGISRAFAYAGCPNIITSLWEMEDMASFFLSSRFYQYLGQGYTIAKALQLAKIDFLEAPQMNQFRHPKYWAQLVYIGNPIGMENGTKWVYLLYILIPISVLLLILIAKKKPSFMKRRA